MKRSLYLVLFSLILFGCDGDTASTVATGTDEGADAEILETSDAEVEGEEGGESFPDVTGEGGDKEAEASRRHIANGECDIEKDSPGNEQFPTSWR